MEAKTPQGRAVGERKKHKKDTELTNLHVLVLGGGGSRGKKRKKSKLLLGFGVETRWTKQ